MARLKGTTRPGRRNEGIGTGPTSVGTSLARGRGRLRKAPPERHGVVGPWSPRTRTVVAGRSRTRSESPSPEPNRRNWNLGRSPKEDHPDRHRTPPVSRSGEVWREGDPEGTPPLVASTFPPFYLANKSPTRPQTPFGTRTSDLIINYLFAGEDLWPPFVSSCRTFHDHSRVCPLPQSESSV